MKFSTRYTIGAAIGAMALTAGYAQAEVPGAGDAQAQMAGPPAPAQQPSTTAQAPTDAPAPAQNSATFSDTELAQFAEAAKAVQEIQADASIAASDKQTKAAAAVQEKGLTPQKFNEIAMATQSDPALMQRIQAAAAKAPGSGTP
ncbi:DUF4168 domain-containing protein [Novosphingobium pentaromativorans]|uniref:DUF4168 domain-containing protein n=1 Tax=Novosphingobium pentaromativorans US6-1 TaxID=1088721 RepID=G6EHA2_9SPHN|nr:DUF4168 domain-containing protein [Novosphingobium pentaromativorans]EHJ59391.1 hypothetical protein NSU_3723 [Novosphingobium pentaromativorans US6-1]